MNFAIVIGCDSYPRVKGGDLRGAVRDALAMVTWLTSQEAALKRDQVVLLASLTAEGAQTSDVEGPATRPELAQRLATLRAIGGDRLYLYFAGHGCRTDPNNPALAQDAILLSDFEPADPGSGSVGVEDLRTRLSLMPFREVVLIIDACRDFPYRESFDLARLGRDPKPVPYFPSPPRLFVIQATSPGEKAVGRELDGEIRGVFSKALTDGLWGAGSAKVFDETVDPPRYEVRWSSLCSYVSGTVTGQSSRYQGEGDISLARFKDGSFSDVQLEVDVQQGESTLAEFTGLSVQVRYPQSGAADDCLATRPGPPPVMLRLPPRRHRIMARAGEAWGKRSVDVYLDTSVELRLSRQGSAIPGEDSIFRSRSLLARLKAVTSDPVGVLDVVNAHGEVVHRAVAAVDQQLPLGSYWVALRNGAGSDDIHAPVDLDAPGEVVSVEVDAGPPPEAADSLPDSLRWATPPAQAIVKKDLWLRDAPPGGAMVVAANLDTQATRPVPNPAVNERHTLDLGGRQVSVPVLPQVVTSVVVAGVDLWVGLYDIGILADPHTLALLDRAQALLAIDRKDAARLVLAELRGRYESRVARALTTRPARGVLSPLARWLPPSTTVGLIGKGPWTVLVG